MRVETRNACFEQILAATPPKTGSSDAGKGHGLGRLRLGETVVQADWPCLSKGNYDPAVAGNELMRSLLAMRLRRRDRASS
jgi:hypothetical protein